MSDCTNVVILAIVARIIHTPQDQLILESILVRIEIRAAPYLPSFNKIPASTIDPEVLAST